MKPSENASAGGAGAGTRTETGIAAVWAWLEATIFFIVPDVFLTRVVLHGGWRRVAPACLGATLSAVTGGWLVYGLAAHGGSQVLTAIYAGLPGISPALIARSGESLGHDGWAALFGGALHGIPYKLYALHAGTQALPVATFLAVSACARLARFALTCLGAWLIAAALLRAWPRAPVLRLHAAAWVIFYTGYFWLMRR